MCEKSADEYGIMQFIHKLTHKGDDPMKICERAVNFIQTIGFEGKIRICGWMFDCVVGNLSENSFYDIYHGKKARAIYHKLGGGTTLTVVLMHAPTSLWVLLTSTS